MSEDERLKDAQSKQRQLADLRENLRLRSKNRRRNTF